MSNIIDFLEKLGQDARLRHATVGEIQEALVTAGVEPVAGVAILAGDRQSLETQLAASSNVCCLIYHPKPDKKGDEDDDEGHKDDDGAKAQYRAHRRAAQKA